MTAPAAPTEQIRSARFRAEREAGWQRLDTLVKRAEKSGAKALGYEVDRDVRSGYWMRDTYSAPC